MCARRLTDRAQAAGRAPAGASAPRCGTSLLAHKRTPPLKAGPVSFKRLLGSRGMTTGCLTYSY